MKRNKYYTCDKCQGSGQVVITLLKSTSKTNYINERICRCPTCWGKGKFDWIENIRKPEPMIKFYTYPMHIKDIDVIRKENILTIRAYTPVWRYIDYERRIFRMQYL